MSGPISSLASLTATYTDSEGEDEHEHQPGVKVGTVVLTEESSLSKPPTPSAPVKRKRTNVKRLVSYQDDHDDTYVTSEDEGEASEEEEAKENYPDASDNIAVSQDEIENSPEAKMQAELEAKASAAAAEGMKLPDEPKGKCSAELQEKINKFHDKMISSGLDMNRVIQQRKDFRNPSIYEKLIQYCKINELGTNYPTEYYDPLRWGKESFYEELAKVQKTDMDKREKERKDKAKVEIVMGTAKRSSTTTTVINKTAQTASSVLAAQLTGIAEEAKRKSKWDQVGGNQQPPQPTALTANITGTKSTVISAFGSLPKRPRN